MSKKDNRQDLNVQDFDYFLPEAQIAQSPLKKRSDSKLLLINRHNKQLHHDSFVSLDRWLKSGDLLVVNNTQVIPARLHGFKDTGAKVEILLLERLNDTDLKALVKPGRRLKKGAKIEFPSSSLRAEILTELEQGERIVTFTWDKKYRFEEILSLLGEMPLPPYIHEKLEEPRRYQTVYAQVDGSAAAPTAGLHFTQEMLVNLQSKGIEIASLTLHVGLGTFRPVSVEKVSQHRMHQESFSLSPEAAEKINRAKQEKRRVIAVGTTSARVLETLADSKGLVKAQTGSTDIFIYPGYEFHCLDGLITNFHLPKSTLLMMVSAFSSREIIFNAYAEAIARDYRFFSFGDATFMACHDI
ncbi:MAG: tRNA preQ1(34) S-adenosylmethionine ribosyltransferase-isomerase QueA [Firmicutes bacterium]|nr:tRNA preQ1(34) S-adenosylmethionine ribosyltransferase-isomerase QueA [Bacillota bacterium]